MGWLKVTARWEKHRPKMRHEGALLADGTLLEQVTGFTDGVADVLGAWHIVRWTQPMTEADIRRMYRLNNFVEVAV